MTSQPTAEQVIGDELLDLSELIPGSTTFRMLVLRAEVAPKLLQALTDAGFRIAPPGSSIVYGLPEDETYDAKVIDSYEGELMVSYEGELMVRLTKRVEQEKSK